MPADKKNNIMDGMCGDLKEITRLSMLGAHHEHEGYRLMSKTMVALVFDNWCPGQQRAYLNKFRHV